MTKLSSVLAFSPKTVLNKIISHRFSAVEVITALVVIDVLCLLWGGIQIIYREHPFNEFISAVANDKPLIAEKFSYAGKQIGIHYFGDFLQPSYWATLSNPWTFDPKFLAQYPSIPVYLLKIFTIFPYKIGLAMFLGLVSLSSALGAWFVSKGLPNHIRLLASISFGLVTTTFLAAFDRGNIVGLLPALFALFIIAILKENRLMASITVGVMACLKIYPALLLVVFIKKRWWKEFGIVVGSSLALTLALFAITPGNIFDTLAAFLKANFDSATIFSGLNGGQLALSTIDVMNLDPALFATIEPVMAIAISAVRYTILALLLIAIFFAKRLRPLELVILAAFAVSVFYSALLTYNWFWAPVACAAILAQMHRETDGQISIATAVAKYPFMSISFVGLLFLCLPIGLHMPGYPVPLTPYIGLAVAFIAAIAAIRQRPAL